MAALMFDLVAEAGAALVLVTHDFALADRAGRRVIMAGGRIVSQAWTPLLSPPLRRARTAARA